MLVYRYQHGLAPSYMSTISTTSQRLLLVVDFNPCQRQCCSFHARDSRQSVTEHSQLPLHSTTRCHFIALSVYFRKHTHSRNFFALFVPGLFYMRTHVLCCMSLVVKVHFLYLHLCGPYQALFFYRTFAAILACVTPIFSVTN